MEIKTFTRKTLDEFVNSVIFDNLAHIPISKHRAASHINNPRCSDSDVILVIAFEADQLAGYLGVLPDYVYNLGEKVKIGWLSCFWVHESFRSSPLSASLLLRVMEDWDHNIMITNFVPSLAPLYYRTGFFQPPMVQEGLRAFMRCNLAEIMPPKGSRYKRIRPVLTVTDFIVNAVGNLRFLFFRGYNTGYINWSYIDLMDEEISAFIKSKNISWTRRGRADLQWILDYPWIIAKSEPEGENLRYYFSSVSKRFLNRLIIISDHGKITGFIMVTIRNNNMTVPYVFSDTGYDSIAEILINIMVELHIDMITLFHPELAGILRSYKIPFLYKKAISKPFLFSRKLDFIDELRFNDGDGDCVFY